MKSGNNIEEEEIKINSFIPKASSIALLNTLNTNLSEIKITLKEREIKEVDKFL